MDKLKQFLRQLHQWHKERTVENNQPNILYTEEQLMARLKFFIGICLALTLFGIVFVVLYSLIFVTQPLNAISPIDQKFFELIVPIATFLTGTLSGIMLAGTKPEDQKAMLEAQKQAQENFAETKKAMLAPPPSTPSTSNFGQMTTRPPVAASSFDHPAFNAEVVTGFGGKPAPAQPPQPLL
jgi:hypothetical protein